MLHNVDLILTLAGGLSAALVLGFITQKLRMSPIVGYLLAGIIVGPYSPGFVADADTASQCAEIGIILLMFGVGLHFHLKDLLAVQRIVLPGAAAQIGAATLLGMVVSHGFGWSWAAGAVFGMAISVASTVVLTRVLSDNKALHTTTGHVALGWLVVEDLFTILLLVLLPAIVGGNEQSESVWHVLAVTTLKLGALVVFALVVGQRIIPKLLAYVARTGTRDLFTLSVLVLALGVAVGAANFFGASMALGAFLSGMVVGQSEFSSQAAAEALPMRDAFAVLFFVSVGMLFNPASLISDWPLILATLGIVLIGKPLAAFIVVKLFGKPLRMALSVAVALAQIGEFSFILAAMGVSFGVLPKEASSAITMNLAANMLGLGNAATPAGQKAMRELKKLSGHDRATDDMVTLLVINNSSLTLVPTTVIALRAQAGSASPSEIFPAALLASAVSTIFAIIFSIALRKKRGDPKC